MHLRSIKIEAPEPIEYQVRGTDKRVCTLDTETDPFKIGRVPKVFCLGFYDGDNYYDFWGPDCVDQWAEFVHTHYAPGSLLIYVHNLPFDFHFLRHYVDHGTIPLIVHRRILKTSICSHEFRDSFKILPVALKKIQKDEIDYALLEPENREANKDEILRYLYGDCFYLYNAIMVFRAEFGDALTIGNVAIRMLNSFSGFERLNARSDALIRPYFYGGRVECFETGILNDEWKVYDVNSMYPDAMSRYRHPISNTIHKRRWISEQTAFVTVTGWSEGALPVRSGPDLAFPKGYGTFRCSIYEYQAAVALGLFRLRSVEEALDFTDWVDFSPFINTFYDKRMKAKHEGDKMGDLLWKLLLNNAYGKFAQNPNNFERAILMERKQCPEEGIYNEVSNPQGWQLAIAADYGWIWTRSAPGWGRDYFNVATGASITGAARATLMRGLASAERPIYCDTDSIICRGISGVDLDPVRLGAWDLEAEGDTAAICGKKTYALMSGDVCVKKASKGVKLEAWQLIEVANGASMPYISDVPNFGLDGSVEFTERVVTRTG